MSYQILAYTVVAPNKPRSGERYKFFEINGCTLLLLATGAPARPCDWRAAEVMAEDFVRQFVDHPTGDPAHRLRQSLHRATDAVSDLTGICEGAQATVCAVWVSENGRFWHLNNSHSKVFRYSNGALTDLAASSEPLAMVAESGHLYEVEEGRLDNSEGLVVASKGVHQHWQPDVVGELEALFKAVHPEADLAALMQNWRYRWDEDLTVLVLQSKNN